MLLAEVSEPPARSYSRAQLMIWVTEETIRLPPTFVILWDRIEGPWVCRIRSSNCLWCLTTGRCQHWMYGDRLITPRTVVTLSPGHTQGSRPVVAAWYGLGTVAQVETAGLQTWEYCCSNTDQYMYGLGARHAEEIASNGSHVQLKHWIAPSRYSSKRTTPYPRPGQQLSRPQRQNAALPGRGIHSLPWMVHLR